MQMLSTERADRNNDLLKLQDTITQLQQNLKSEQHAAEGKVLILGFRVQILVLRWKCFNRLPFSAEERDPWSPSGSAVIR